MHVILAGWAAHPAVLDAFHAGAREFAPNVRTSFPNGRDGQVRRSVWRAADVFVSPSDSVQETFGLSVVEAMASGLPVVASDWNGYRDSVEDGRTGFLVPTTTVSGATAIATARLLAGELNYDHFLAECSQATAVDIPGHRSRTHTSCDRPSAPSPHGRRRPHACDRTVRLVKSDPCV